MHVQDGLIYLATIGVGALSVWIGITIRDRAFERHADAAIALTHEEEK